MTGSRPRHLPAWLAAVAIGSQICWVLVGGTGRDVLTVAGVLAFAAASVTHAWVHRGRAWTLRFFVPVLLFGWGVEALGTTTGFPFGAYQYTGRLGPELGPVPLVIPLAWAMMAYPAAVLARRAAATTAGGVALAAALLSSWDLFLDPQMVAEGHWVFAHPVPALPGAPGTPLVNYAGWLLAAVVLMTALAVIAPDPGPPDPGALAVPALLVGWVYAGNVLANLAFWGRPGVALIGGLGMGIPLWLTAAGLRHQGVTLATVRGAAAATGAPR